MTQAADTSFKPRGSDDAIKVTAVSKVFRIPHERRRSIYDNIAGLIRGNSFSYESMWALRNVDFSIKRGETVGVIGENGSGKSTLLKIIAGVLTPDSGTVTVKGKIAPFLELGVGFHPELSATDNVYLYGSIMGLSREQVTSKMEAIFEFAELQKFRNAKLKNFSSGMYARLAFSTAISTDPDILLIDEALSVGDEAFQKKCFDKINEFKRKGKTILFVSHGMGIVSQICERAILLDHGSMVSIGPTEKVVTAYHDLLNRKQEAALSEQHDSSRQQAVAEPVKAVSDPQARQFGPIINEPDRWGSREIEILDVRFYGKDGLEKHIFKSCEPMFVRIRYFAKTKVEKPVFGIAIHRNDGIHVTGHNTKKYGNVIDSVEGEGTVSYEIISVPMMPGTYLFTAAVYDYPCVHPYDHHHMRYDFRVIENEITDTGLIYIPCRWKYE